MDMIAGSSRKDQGDVFFSRNTTEVTAELHRIRDRVNAFFCAEDAMHQIGRKGVWHADNLSVSNLGFGDIWHKGMCRPRGTPVENTRFPTAEALGFLVPRPRRWQSRFNGRRAITGDTALRLAHFFGTSPEFWLNLQSLYEIRLAERKSGQSIKTLPTLKRAHLARA